MSYDVIFPQIRSGRKNSTEKLSKMEKHFFPLFSKNPIIIF